MYTSCYTEIQASLERTAWHEIGYGAIIALAGECDWVALDNHPSRSELSTDSEKGIFNY